MQADPAQRGACDAYAAAIGPGSRGGTGEHEGGEASEHGGGAWQIYQHTGDVEFLKDCYEGHFKKLFWK